MKISGNRFLTSVFYFCINNINIIEDYEQFENFTRSKEEKE